MKFWKLGLRGAESKGARAVRLATSIDDAIGSYGLLVKDAVTASPDDEIKSVLVGYRYEPILVVSATRELLGIVTAFDLL